MAQPTSPVPRSHTRLLAALVAGCFAGSALAMPTGAQVAAGTAALTQTGNVLTINNSANAILNWQKFNIAAHEAVRFNQPSASSSVLNRVVGADPSSILGQLSSNGRVWLVNPAGILVGAGARIDTAAFVASTLNLRNEDFLAGKLTFGGNDNAGGIVNRGAITTPGGGSVYLIAPDVRNEGIVTTPGGETILAAGQTVQLVDTATPGVKVEVTGATGNATNLGSIVAEAGRIGMAGVLVKNSGTLNASSVVSEGGRIFLKASQDAYVDGDGRIVATGRKGGSADVLGQRVAVADRARIDVSGEVGGGSVRVGGDYQGKNADVQNAAITWFGPQAGIKADALVNGDGGRVIVWADDTTRAYGSISARGGVNGGNGGFVETSGHYLEARGRVDLSAPQGRVGSWLLDPVSITITGGNGTGTTGATAGTILFTEGTGNATVYQTEIESQSSTANITLEATDGIDTIGVFTGGAVTLAANSNLTLRTRNQTTPDAPTGINLTGSNDGAALEFRTSGTGTITIETGVGGTGPYQSAPIVTGKLTSAADITLNASGDVEIKGLVTSTAGNIAATSLNGSITVASGATITANQLKMTAATGVSNGTGGPASTDVAVLNVLNTGAGAIRIGNSNRNLTIADIGAVGYGAKQEAPGQPIFIDNAAGVGMAVNASVLTDGGDIALQAPAGLTLSSGKSISTGSGYGYIKLVANDMSLSGNINAGTSGGGVLLTPYDVTRVMDVGTDTANTLGLTNAELGNITAQYLTVGDGSVLPTAGLTVSAPVSLANVRSLTLNNVGGVNIDQPLSLTQPGGSVLVNASKAGTAPSLVIGAAGGVSVSGDLANPGSIAFFADGMDLGTNPGRIDAGASGGVSLNPQTEAKPVVLGFSGTKNNSAALQLTPSDLASISAGKLSIGTVGTGQISTMAAIALSNVASLGLASDAGIHFAEALTLLGPTSTLYLNAFGNAVTQAAAGVITADRIQLDNGATITLNTAANSVNHLNGAINPTGAGSIAFKNNKALTVSTLSTGAATAPTIDIETTSGSLNVGTILATGGSMSLKTADSIIDTNGSDNNVTATTLTVDAGNGLSLDTAVSTLTAGNTATNANGIGIRNTGNLSVAGISDTSVCGAVPPANCTGPAGINLANTGTLDLTGAVTAGGLDSSVHIGAGGAVTQSGAISGHSVGISAPSLASSAAITAGSNAAVMTDALTFSGGGMIYATAGGIDVSTYTAGKSITVGTGCVTTNCLLLDDLSKFDAPMLAIGRDAAQTYGFAAPVSGAIDITAGINRGAGKIAFLSGGAIVQDATAQYGGIVAHAVGALTSGPAAAVSLDHASNSFANIVGETNGGAFSAKSSQTLAVSDYIDSLYAADFVYGISTAGGNVTLTTTAGDINIPSQINAGTGTVTLNSAGKVYGSGTSPDVVAASVIVNAATGIDGVGGFQTDAPAVNLNNTGGDVYWASFTPAGTTLTTTDGIYAVGNIKISAFNAIPLTIDALLDAGGNIEVAAGSIVQNASFTASGSVAVNATSGNIVMSTDAVTSGSAISYAAPYGTVTYQPGNFSGAVPSVVVYQPPSPPPPPPPPPPSIDTCVANPATSGCSAVLPTVDACTTNPAAPGCTAVLPPLATCTSVPATPGCSVVLPSLSTCTANPTAAGCTTVLPPLSTCTSAPTTPGCSVVLPSLATCTTNPTAAGCTTVLPPLATCASAPTTAGCSAVLPSLATCTTNPTAAGCTTVLPPLATCTSAPATPGCSAVLPSVDACVVNPAAAGCSTVLPPLSSCTTAPTTPGCSAVLPPVETCATNPALAGCSAVLPTVASCAANPAQTGCAAVLPPVAATTASTNEIVAMTTAVTNTTSETTSAAPPPPPPPPPVAPAAGPTLLLLNSNQTIGGTEGSFGGASAPSGSSQSGAAGSAEPAPAGNGATAGRADADAQDKKDDKKDDKADDKKDAPAKKQQDKPAAKKAAICS